MNKQEAIEKIKEVSWVCEDNSTVISLDYAQEIISQIDEPQKPVVPKFAADLYEAIKDNFENKVYDLCVRFDSDNGELSSELYEWFDCGKNEPIQTLVKMKFYGYEVEQEKLYTVEIPNPNSNWKYTFLTKKDNRGVIIFRTDDDCWKQKNNQLTEAEIKQDFEWAWQWAKEVKNGSTEV